MDEKKISYLERNYRFVFQPYKRTLMTAERGRRFYIGSGQMEMYIGQKNTETVLRKAEAMKTDKLRLKFRETGIIDIYVR